MFGKHFMSGLSTILIFLSMATSFEFDRLMLISTFSQSPSKLHQSQRFEQYNKNIFHRFLPTPNQQPPEVMS